jgi:hypothetical protein
MIRKKAALALDPRVDTGFPKSMPSGLTRGITLNQTNQSAIAIQHQPIALWAFNLQRNRFRHALRPRCYCDQIASQAYQLKLAR